MINEWFLGGIRRWLIKRCRLDKYKEWDEEKSCGVANWQELCPNWKNVDPPDKYVTKMGPQFLAHLGFNFFIFVFSCYPQLYGKNIISF